MIQGGTGEWITRRSPRRREGKPAPAANRAGMPPARPRPVTAKKAAAFLSYSAEDLQTLPRVTG